MVYGIIELINFAHGDIFMIGTFVSISVLGLIGITVGTQPVGGTLIGALVVTGLFCILVCAVLGVVIERVAYRPLRNAPRLAPLISAIGVSLVLQNVGILWKGVNFVSFPQFYFFIGAAGEDAAAVIRDCYCMHIFIMACETAHLFTAFQIP